MNAQHCRGSFPTLSTQLLPMDRRMRLYDWSHTFSEAINVHREVHGSPWTAIQYDQKRHATVLIIIFRIKRCRLFGIGVVHCHSMATGRRASVYFRHLRSGRDLDSLDRISLLP